MKFLNHLDLVENEARRLKMYRVAAGSYTPGVTTSGNIIMDTAAAIPKWWDGSVWRDFSYGTAGAGSWNIQSDSGANIAVHATDTLDLTGGHAMGTVTTGTAAAPIVTFNVKTYGVAGGSTTGARGGDATTKIYGVERHPTTDKLQVHVPWEDSIANTNTVTSIRRDNTGTYRTGNINLISGTNVTITESSAGVFNFASANTQYSALTHSVLGLAKTRFSTINNITPIALSDVAARTYGVQKNSSDQLVVTVPWVNTAPPANIVNTVNTTDGTYINLTPNSAATGAVTVTADLSAVNGSYNAEDPRVLSKNNKWVTVSSINSGVNTDIDVNNTNLRIKLAALE